MPTNLKWKNGMCTGKNKKQETQRYMKSKQTCNIRITESKMYFVRFAKR